MTQLKHCINCGDDKEVTKFPYNSDVCSDCAFHFPFSPKELEDIEKLHKRIMEEIK